jgi:hypothetical protein
MALAALRMVEKEKEKEEVEEEKRQGEAGEAVKTGRERSAGLRDAWRA